jgi:hypothetical protein
MVDNLPLVNGKFYTKTANGTKPDQFAWDAFDIYFRPGDYVQLIFYGKAWPLAA